jgi:hypothetical protein
MLPADRETMVSGFRGPGEWLDYKPWPPSWPGPLGSGTAIPGEAMGRDAFCSLPQHTAALAVQPVPPQEVLIPCLMPPSSPEEQCGCSPPSMCKYTIHSRELHPAAGCFKIEKDPPQLVPSSRGSAGRRSTLSLIVPSARKGGDPRLWKSLPFQLSFSFHSPLPPLAGHC